MESRVLKFKKFMDSEESKEPAMLIRTLIGGTPEPEANNAGKYQESSKGVQHQESKVQEIEDRSHTPFGDFHSPFSRTIEERENVTSERMIFLDSEKPKTDWTHEKERNKLFTFAPGYQKLDERETTQENAKDDDFQEDQALDQLHLKDDQKAHKIQLNQMNDSLNLIRAKKRKSRVLPVLGISDTGFRDTENFETDLIATSPYADDYYVRLRQIHRLKRCIILPDDPWKQIWDVYITMQVLLKSRVLVFTVIATPYRIAFHQDDGVFWTFIEYAVDVSFLCDMIFQFRQAYFNSQDKLVTSLSAIACTYLKGWFAIDFVAIFPLNQILRLASRAGSSLNQMARLARLPRLYKVMQFSRICKLCKRPNSKHKFLKSLNDMLKVSAACERMLVFLMILIIMCHMVSCMWYFVAVVEDSPNSWIHSFPELSTDGQFYFVGIYFTITTITTVGYGDISASTNGERFLCSVLMLLGVVGYSYAIGSLSSILTTLDAKTAKLKEKLSILENIRKQFKLNFILYRKMKTAIHFDHTKDLTDKYALINALPLRLQVELSIVVHQQLIEDIHFFKNKPGQFIAMVAPRLKSVCLPKADYIFHEKDPIDALYFLRKGTVGLVVRKFPSDLVFIKVKQGSYFGEYDFLISGLNQGKRCFTAKALTDVELLLLDKLDLYRIDQEFKVVTEQLFSHAFPRLRQAQQAKSRAEKWLKRKISSDRLSGPLATGTLVAGPFMPKLKNSQQTVTEQVSADFGQSSSQVLNSQELTKKRKESSLVESPDRFQKLADFLQKHCSPLQQAGHFSNPHDYIRALPTRTDFAKKNEIQEAEESSFSSAMAGIEPLSPSIKEGSLIMPPYKEQGKTNSKSRDRYSSQLLSKDSYLHKNQIIQQRAYQLNPHVGKLENSMITLLSKLGDRLASIETKMTKLNQSDRRESFKATMKRTDSEPVKERRISIEPETTPYSSLLLPQRSAQKSKEELLSQRLKLKNELRSKISHDDAQEKDEAWKW